MSQSLTYFFPSCNNNVELIEYKTGQYVAVTYMDDWYFCQIVSKDNNF